ncbi:MAG: DNA gyrase C-terminal beta-propeller domain-containing protein, partial [Longimicrobiales bacterium]
GSGVINLKVSEKTGEVVAVRAVDEDEQLMMITKKGVVNRQRVSEIRVIGRATQGVKLMNLDDGDVVVDVARVVIDDEHDEEFDGEGGSIEGEADETVAPVTDQADSAAALDNGDPESEASDEDTDES